MATIANLIVEISSKDSKLRRGLGKAGASVKKFAKAAVKNIALIGGAITALAVGGFALLTRMINKQAAEIDKLAKTSAKLGTTVAAFQRLSYQAELTGISTETLGTALQRMVRRVSEAAQGTGAAKNAIAELGLSAERLSQMRPEEQFRLIAERMRDVGSSGDQVRLAMQIFDTEGVGLVNTFNSNLKETGAEFDRLGLSISQSQAQAVEAYNDSKTKLSAIFDSMSKKVTALVSPAFESIVTWITDTIDKMGGMDSAAEKFAKGIVGAVKTAVQAINGLINIIDGAYARMIKMQIFAKEQADSLPDPFFLTKAVGEKYGIFEQGGAAQRTLNRKEDLRGLYKELNELERQVQARKDFLKPLVDTIEREKGKIGQALQPANDPMFDILKGSKIGEVVGQLNDSQMKVRNNYVELADATKETATKIKEASQAVDDAISSMQNQAGQSELNRILGLDQQSKDAGKPLARDKKFDQLIRDVYRKSNSGVQTFSGTFNGENKTFKESSIKSDISRLQDIVKDYSRGGENTLGMQGALEELQKFVDNKQAQKVNVDIKVDAAPDFLTKVATSQELDKAVDKKLDKKARDAAKTIKG